MFNETFTLRDEVIRYALRVAYEHNIIMLFWQNGSLWETDTYRAKLRPPGHGGSCLDIVTVRYVLPHGEITKLS